MWQGGADFLCTATAASSTQTGAQSGTWQPAFSKLYFLMATLNARLPSQHHVPL